MNQEGPLTVEHTSLYITHVFRPSWARSGPFSWFRGIESNRLDHLKVQNGGCQVFERGSLNGTSTPSRERTVGSNLAKTEQLKNAAVDKRASAALRKSCKPCFDNDTLCFPEESLFTCVFYLRLCCSCSSFSHDQRDLRPSLHNTRSPLCAQSTLCLHACQWRYHHSRTRRSALAIVH